MYPLRDIAAWMADKPYMDIDQDLLTDKHIEDILDIFPGQLLISKYQLAKLRGTSESTLNREKKRSEGIPPKEKGGRTLYLVRDTAEWLSSTIKTTNKRRRIDENNR